MYNAKHLIFKYINVNTDGLGQPTFLTI